MAKKNGDPETLDLRKAAQLLETHWQAVVAKASIDSDAKFITFLHKVGEHLDTWNTQPSHRQAWKKILESI